MISKDVCEQRIVKVSDKNVQVQYYLFTAKEEDVMIDDLTEVYDQNSIQIILDRAVLQKAALEDTQAIAEKTLVAIEEKEAIITKMNLLSDTMNAD